jgi:hypothetical protein
MEGSLYNEVSRQILDMSEWCRRGWKIRKQEVRSYNAFHIIISSVLPFLDSLVLPAGSREPVP